MVAAPWAMPAGPHFETLLELGQGGMATAFLARSLGAGGFERLVVLKRLNLELSASPEAIERFLAEARIAARLHHVNVIGTQQVGRDSAGPYIVLDYVEGGAIDELCIASGMQGEKLEPRILLRIVLDALLGLTAVHEATDTSGSPLAILHRDISLENVLVSVHDGIARVSDFGVARSVLSPVRTAPNYFVGKLLYLAPEYLLRDPIGPTLDVYALGVTLWLALSGERPWENLSEGQIIHAIVEDGLPPLERQVTLAPELYELVARACARDPRQRFQSAREMARVIEGFDRERGWVASHAEVAARVDELLGPLLRERRQALAQREREHQSPPPLPLPARPALAAPLIPPAAAFEPTVPTARATPRPKLRALGATSAFFGFAALGLAGWAAIRRNDHAVAPRAAVTLATPSEPRARASGTPMVVPVTTSPAAEPSNTATTFEHTPAVPSSAPRAPRSSPLATHRRTEPAPPSVDFGAASAEIQRKNPYR